jgi:1-pyrroline-5-carboxylate dehydrogenase
MANGIFTPPAPQNEPVFEYGPGSVEKKNLKAALKAMKSEEKLIPMYIGGKEVYTDNRVSMHPPHEVNHTLGHYCKGDASHVNQAIDAALAAKEQWENMDWKDRASIFLKAADLISGPYRSKISAATMLCQSKTVYQSEIDAVAELADFLRFNVYYLEQLYKEQPIRNSPGIWNRMEYRPLEGFVLAITPFNFTAIAGNLPTAPAMCGNVVVWKPAETQIYSAQIVMEILREAGLPDGVINLVYASGPTIGDIVFEHADFAGLHFTGSTGVFQHLWKTIGNNIAKYKTYPRIVGETGGKDFVMAHPSADVDALVVALVRGAFEFQGQKCSAASRAYIPESMWSEVQEKLVAMTKSISIGSPEDFRNFFTAVIDEKAFDKIAEYIDQAKQDANAEIVVGGNYDKSKGYFIDPTIVLAKDPKYRTMCEEIFGPVLTVYIYPDNEFEQTLDLLDETSPYGLTGAIFSQDRYAIGVAERKLRHAAGNFYINDKPTGAVVGQQPFGGARASGTNDKAGAPMNLQRWMSARSIKENLVPPKDYRYPFMAEE